jgi:hypothetical protein
MKYEYKAQIFGAYSLIFDLTIEKNNRPLILSLSVGVDNFIIPAESFTLFLSPCPMTKEMSKNV